MNQSFRNFYKSAYLQTGGYLPAKPFGQLVFPGDLFQIVNGQVVVLDNIFKAGLIDQGDIHFRTVNQKEVNWTFSQGITKPYSGRDIGVNALKGDFEYSKLVLSFKEKGSFIFKGKSPQAVSILNWADLASELIVKLTCTHFSFREVYVATESVSLAEWTLAVAASKKAELEIVTDSENFGLVDIFGNNGTKTVQSKYLEYYDRSTKREPIFFKAKKLVVNKDMIEVLISKYYEAQKHKLKWLKKYFDFEIAENDGQAPPTSLGQWHVGLLDSLKAGELNPSNAIHYFGWQNADLDDVAKLFVQYNE